MYFGSTIMTFALPYGAFIAASIALYYLFRARHSGPRLRWSAGSAAQVTSVTTREPGPAPAVGMTTAMSALPVPTEQPVAPASEPSVPEAPAPEAPAPEATAPPTVAADANLASDSPPDDNPPEDSLEGKDGEHG
jgi:hypothetical protein